MVDRARYIQISNQGFVIGMGHSTQFNGNTHINRTEIFPLPSSLFPVKDQRSKIKEAFRNFARVRTIQALPRPSKPTEAFLMG